MNAIDPGSIAKSLLPEINSSTPQAAAARAALVRCERMEESIAGQFERLRELAAEQQDCLAMIRALQMELRTDREEVEHLIKQLRDRQKVTSATASAIRRVDITTSRG